jgi:tRNA(fMet)-specific endonuclease VapC
MVVIDTDVLSLMQSGSAEGMTARSRIDLSGQPNAITIVTVEEQFRGRVNYCSRATTPEQYVAAGLLLHSTLDDVRGRTVLDFDARAAAEFARLKGLKVRIGINDLRIAAIVLANDATLVTRNLADFRKVPRLRAEDWTKP